MARRSAISGSAAWVAVLAATLIVGAALWLALRRHDDAVAEGQQLKVVNGWFPEPSYLLDHATVLELTPAQKRHVQSTDREWEMKKAAFESRFKTFNLSADTALSDLKANSVPTGDVGSLVQDFDKARARAWSSATLPLNPYQVEKLDKLRDQDEKGKKTAFAPTENRLVVLNNSESTTQSPIEIRPLAEVGRAKSNTSAMKQDQRTP